MAGGGGVTNGKWDGNVPPECKPNPSILRFSAQLKWEEAHEPLHADIDVGKTCGIGPGMAFANAVRANGSRIGVVGLVPCAVGGTKISDWARGTRLYGQLVRGAIDSVRDGGTIRAMLWYQGQSDTVRREDAKAYKGNMERLIMDLRSDLNIPTLQIIQDSSVKIVLLLLGTLDEASFKRAFAFTFSHRGGTSIRGRQIYRDLGELSWELTNPTSSV